VPVEECDTEPEREPCTAEGVDAGEAVAVSVLAIVKVPLTLGEAEVDTVADEVEKREGVDAAEGVAEAEDTGVFERVAEGDREMEPVTVAETVNLVDQVAAAVDQMLPRPHTHIQVEPELLDRVLLAVMDTYLGVLMLPVAAVGARVPLELQLLIMCPALAAMA
jgi:hypothetical protein